MTPLDTDSWFKYIREHFGPIPDDYLVIDSETSGLDPDTDVILQLGWCEVRDRKIVDNDGALLNWFDRQCPLVNRDWLRARLDRTRLHMLKNGNGYPWTEAVLSQGAPPLDALADLFVRLKAHDLPALVAHNGWLFDVPMMTRHFQRFLEQDYIVPLDRLWDTGAIEKGVQLALYPKPGDTQRDFAYRVMSRIARIKWSLANHCVPKYNLAQKHNLNMNQSHTAPFDCLATHYLLETYREIMEGTTVEAETSLCTGSSLAPVTLT